eukprot:82930_1
MILVASRLNMQTMHFIFLVIWIHITISLRQKETKLNAEIASQNGASIIHNPSNVAISGTEYNIKVHSDAGYDLQISLDASWGFERDIESQIAFTLNGYTPNPSVDTDLLLVFSVADWQYFSFFIHLDATNKMRSRIYYAMSSASIAHPVSEWLSNSTIQTRWDRISNNNQWQLIYDWNKQAMWPLKFVITNNPLQDQTVFEFYHTSTETYATGYVFNHCFVANERMNVYIMGDSLGERYNISSIDIDLNDMDDDQTLLPTDAPTVSPTPEPTESPTVSPTNEPTFTPTVAPSLSTNIDTLSPTYTPTIEPTLVATTDTDYGVEMIITFKYTFSVLEISEIMVILHELTDTDQENHCNEWNHEIMAEDHNQTVISATILMCDESTQNELLVAVNNGDLQSEILQSIRTQTSLMVLANQTTIRADRIPLDDFATKTTETALLRPPWHLQRRKQSMNYDLLLIIIAIAVPVVSCCFCMSYCKKKPNVKRQHIQKQIGLSFPARNVVSMSNIADSDDDVVSPRNMRSPSSKSYHYNVRCEATSANADNVSYAMSPQSISVMIGPRDYKTRGISDDMYDERITKGGSQTYYEEEGSGSSDRRGGDRLSTASRVNANSYPPPKSEITESQSTSSPKYELPKYKVTKRQWL